MTKFEDKLSAQLEKLCNLVELGELYTARNLCQRLALLYGDDCSVQRWIKLLAVPRITRHCKHGIVAES